jgi:hypothetical protein
MTLFEKVSPDVQTTSQHVRTLPSVPEYSGSPLRMRKGVTVKTVRTLGQAVRMWSCFGRNCAILERLSQKTLRTQLSDHLDAAQRTAILSRIRFSEAYK